MPTTKNIIVSAADATVSCGTGTASQVQDGTASKSVDNSANDLYVTWYRSASSVYSGKQPIFVFDTSIIPDGVIIQAASLFIYVSSKSTVANTNYDYIAINNDGTLDNPVTTASWDGRPSGTANLSENIEIDNIDTSAWNEIPLNAAGIAAINDDAVTQFRLAEGISIVNAMNDIAIGEKNEVVFNSGDNASNKPYLQITYPSNITIGFML